MIIGQIISLIVAVLFAVFTSVVGFHLLKSIRGMTRDGTAYVVFDLRRLFGHTPRYARHTDQGQFWLSIAINAFCATIVFGFAGGMLLMLIFGFGEMFVAR